MSERADARVLLSKAREDLAAVHALLAASEISDAVIGFHAQQAVEKTMKAVLASKGDAFPWTHDLSHLLERLASVGVDVPIELREARRLAPWAVEYRYGQILDSSLDRAATAQLVASVVAWAADLVGTDGD